MSTKDYYAILGVLPDAEDVVIRAAYRALAQRYHPDRWQGHPAEGHERMIAINEAYAVLRDSIKRAEYDAERAKDNGAELGDEKEQEYAFSSALGELEERWEIACNIYPEIREERARLNIISKALSFAFVALLVETKSYVRHAKIASDMETRFLERYFGTNKSVVEYARSLILKGRRDEARALNKLVNVMGTEADPARIIGHIERTFRKSIEKARMTAWQEAAARKAADEVLRHGYYDEALALARYNGYSVAEVGGGIFTASQIMVTSPSATRLQFKNTGEFIEWVKTNFTSFD
jgi:curved DNA-binding protein CbpA